MRQIFFKKQDLVSVIRRQGFFFFPKEFHIPLAVFDAFTLLYYI